MYKVIFTDNSLKQLKKMDKSTYVFLISWIKKNLENCEDPRKIGKNLVGNFKESWRYRVGKYRIIVEIKDDYIIILILNIGHRKEIYKR